MWSGLRGSYNSGEAFRALYWLRLTFDPHHHAEGAVIGLFGLLGLEQQGDLAEKIIKTDHLPGSRIIRPASGVTFV